MFDIVIIGGGAAGMSAALYAGRGGMKTLVIEAVSVGGQMNQTYEIANYPGVVNNPDGTSLALLMKGQAAEYGAQFSSETVKDIIDIDGKIKKVVTRKNTYETKAIIFATGANPRKLGVAGEEKFHGMGVSYCATCDGAFFKGQETCVIGGGNTAFEDALYLARFCKKVYLIHRREGFRAEATMVNAVKNNEKIEFILNSTVEEINGDTTVDSVTVKNVDTGAISNLKVNGVFIAVGRDANTTLAGKYLRLDQDGFIVTDRYMQTNIKGVYAAGDVRDTPLRQVVTAAADGAVAATTAIHYISE